jgi:hypothetical protein
VRAADVLSLGLGVLMTLVTLAMQPWTPQWWLLVIADAFVVVGASLHMMLGGGFQRIAKITSIALLAVGAPCFGAWYHLNYPASQKIVQVYFPSPVLSKPNQPPVVRKIDATLGKAYYKCKTKDAESTKEEAEKNAADFKAYIEAWANAYGYKPPTVSPVPGGLKAEILPPTNADPFKRTFQVVKIGKQLFGIYSADYTSPYYSASAMVQNSPLESSVHNVIEGLAKLEPGSCELQ